MKPPDDTPIEKFKFLIQTIMADGISWYDHVTATTPEIAAEVVKSIVRCGRGAPQKIQVQILLAVD